MRLVTVVCTVLLAGLLGCSQADQARAREKAERARKEARKLGTEAEVKAKELNSRLGQSLDGRGAGGTAANQTPEQKLQEAAAVARQEGQMASKKLDHAGMVARVKTKLADDVGLATVSGVSVDVRGSVVTLSGTVSSEEQKQQAERSASAVEGVSQVVNHLSVQP